MVSQSVIMKSTLTMNYSGGVKSTFGDNKSKSGKMLAMVTEKYIGIPHIILSQFL